MKVDLWLFEKGNSAVVCKELKRQLQEQANAFSDKRRRYSMISEYHG